MLPIKSDCNQTSVWTAYDPQSDPHAQKQNVDVTLFTEVVMDAAIYASILKVSQK